MTHQTRRMIFVSILVIGGVLLLVALKVAHNWTMGRVAPPARAAVATPIPVVTPEHLEIIVQPLVTPTPTATPYPTYTLYPTATPYPTYTPYPTVAGSRLERSSPSFTPTSSPIPVLPTPSPTPTATRFPPPVPLSPLTAENAAVGEGAIIKFQWRWEGPDPGEGEVFSFKIIRLKDKATCMHTRIAHPFFDVQVACDLSERYFWQAILVRPVFDETGRQSGWLELSEPSEPQYFDYILSREDDGSDDKSGDDEGGGCQSPPFC